MINQQRTMLSSGLLLGLIFLASATLGCKMLGGGSTQTDGSGDAKDGKGIAARKVCQVLAHPNFENNSPYNGQSCSGSTYFGAKDIRTGSYQTDSRPSFSYAAIGEENVITRVTLSMSKRPDGAEFFAAEGDAVAKLINGQPLPGEIRNAIITQRVSGGLLGPTSTTTSEIGKAKVELVRSDTDDSFSLSFKF